MATKKKAAAKTKEPRTGTKKEKIVSLYEKGKTAVEIIETTGFKKNTVEGRINQYRAEHKLAHTGKVFNKEGKLVDKPVAEKKAKVAKKKAAPAKKKAVKKAAKKTTTKTPNPKAKSKKKAEAVTDAQKPETLGKPGAGTKVAFIAEEPDEVIVPEVELDERTGKPIVKF